MGEQSLPIYCSSSPDKFLQISNIILKTLEPPDNCPFKGLSKEIWDKFNDNKQTIDKFTNKINLWKQLNKLIKANFPQHGLFTAGSSVNGFGLKNSDIDFSFLSSVSKSRKREESTVQLTKFRDCINKYDQINFNQLEIINAFVPLIHFHDRKWDLDVDINYNATANIRNSHLLLNYSLMDWRVRPLVIVIKLWAKHHNLIDARYGSLSSYPLILLVIHYLQCGVKPAILPNLQVIFKNQFNDTCSVQKINFVTPIANRLVQIAPKKDPNLEDLLIGFFKYYQNFEFDKFVISIRRGDKIPLYQYLLEKLQLKNLSEEGLTNFVTANTYMFIEEPFNLSNVGKTVRKITTFQKIKSCFKNSHEKLKQDRRLSAIF